jgi:class 3 adenylate cyclase/tetratricopeptide (TPR) repeat protein
MPNPEPRSYTPKHLADKILQSKSALEGERKQVTVLFADVRGSMELAEQLDPEEWHAILDRFFQILADGVHRFEGTVNQYTGDGIMALFGAPIAHEDHAQRACYTALHLRSELKRYADELRLSSGLSFSVRMGLNSGDVVVGRIGDDLRMDYTAQGHTVNLAARMQQIAAADQVYLTEETERLVSGYFSLRDLGESRIKGTSAPVHVHELTGEGALRTRFDMSRARGLSTFVGRSTEMAALEAAFESAVEGRGRVVGIVAEAGTGKSRLCFEFTERCRARGVSVHCGQGVAHGKTLPLLPVLGLMRDVFGIRTDDEAARVRQKIAGALALLGESSPDAFALLFDLFGVPEGAHAPTDANVRQQQLFGLITRLLQARSKREPGIFLLEDLHWFDGASDQFLQRFLAAIPDTRTLVLLNFRPEYQSDWMRQPFYQQLPLTPLGAEASQELLHALLGTDPSLAPLLRMIPERTAGNPFFMEEVVQSLADAGVLQGDRGHYRLVGEADDLVLPSGVHALLAARIDRLAAPEKNLLQTGSVIGKGFPEPLLASVAGLARGPMDETLSALVRGGFIYEEALFPTREFAFKHPLTHEVAYRTLLSEPRARLHERVARELEKAVAEEQGETAALLAYHWEGAGDALAAARWHRRAAEWIGINDTFEAFRHWKRVGELLEGTADSEEADVLRGAAAAQLVLYGVRVGMSEEELNVALAETERLAERTGDLRPRIAGLSSFAVFKTFAGGVAEGATLSKEALRLAEQQGSEDLIANTRIGLCINHFLAGRPRESLQEADEILKTRRSDASNEADSLGYSPVALAHVMRAFSLVFRAEWNEAEAAIHEALRLAREANNLFIEQNSYFALSQRAILAGEAATAVSHARHCVELGEATGSVILRTNSNVILGASLTSHGLLQEGQAALERALDLIHNNGGPAVMEPLALANLSACTLAQGDQNTAVEFAEKALALARAQETRRAIIEAQLARARATRALLSEAARDEVAEALDDAERVVDETGANAYRPAIHEERAALAQILGDEPTRMRELREAHRLYGHIGAEAHAGRVARELQP